MTRHVISFDTDSIEKAMSRLAGDRNPTRDTCILFSRDVPSSFDPFLDLKFASRPDLSAGAFGSDKGIGTALREMAEARQANVSPEPYELEDKRLYARIDELKGRVDALYKFCEDFAPLKDRIKDIEMCIVKLHQGQTPAKANMRSGVLAFDEPWAPALGCVPDGVEWVGVIKDGTMFGYPVEIQRGNKGWAMENCVRWWTLGEVDLRKWGLSWTDTKRRVIR